MGAEKKSSFLKELFLFCLVLFLCFMVLESSARVFNLTPTYFWEFDEELGKQLVPNKKGLYETHEFSVPIIINSKGQHDYEYEYKKPPGTFRILVLGDSFAESVQVPIDFSAQQVLEDHLNKVPNKKKEYKKIEVINMGVSGYGPDQELILLQKEGFKYDPDVVVVYFLDHNDLRDVDPLVSGKKNKPYFTLEKNGSLTQEPYDGKSTLRDTLRYKVMSFRVLEHLVAKNPSLVAFLNKLGLVRAPSASPDKLPLSYYVFLPEYDQNWEHAWKMVKALFKKMDTTINERNTLEQKETKFIIISMTGVERMYGPSYLKTQQEKYPNILGVEWDFVKPDVIMDEFTEKENITFIKTLPAFIEDYEKHKKPLHFMHDGHMNERGNRLLGKLLFDEIKPLVQQS